MHAGKLTMIVLGGGAVLGAVAGAAMDTAMKPAPEPAWQHLVEKTYEPAEPQQIVEYGPQDLTPRPMLQMPVSVPMYAADYATPEPLDLYDPGLESSDLLADAPVEELAEPVLPAGPDLALDPGASAADRAAAVAREVMEAEAALADDPTRAAPDPAEELPGGDGVPALL